MRVAAVRAAMKLLAKERAQRPRADEADEIAQHVLPDGDPELELLRATFKQDFLDAFRAAIAGLSRRERSLLRLTFIDHLTPALLRTALHGGRLTPAELTARRDAWLSSWKARLTPVSRSFHWPFGYARVADTPEAARAALDVLPSYGPLPPYRPQRLVEADVGRTYLLAGQPALALPWLERAARKCEVISYPFEHVRAHLLLGQAREATGDTLGACAAYGRVLDRWGHATPRSVTAEQAKARVQALDCQR